MVTPSFFITHYGFSYVLHLIIDKFQRVSQFIPKSVTAQIWTNLNETDPSKKSSFFVFSLMSPYIRMVQKELHDNN